MTAIELASLIVEFCQEHASDEQILKNARFFKTGFQGYGLNQPNMNEAAKMWAKNPDISMDVILEAAPGFLKSGMYEETTLILLLLNARKKFYTPKVFHEIEMWFEFGIHNWAHADTLGMWILPEFLLKGIVPMSYFEPWLHSEHSYKRRCVPVTLIKHVKTIKNAPPLLNFIEILMTDKVREVQQGTGWFLREAWRIENQSVETFLLKWKEHAPRLIYQYACEKMDAEQKQNFKKTVKS